MKKIHIIAEIGINHGDIKLAKLIDEASQQDLTVLNFKKEDRQGLYKQFLDSERQSPWETLKETRSRDLNLIKNNI